MKLEKLFGSKTKSDILKYLVFRRQGISMRAFEHELQRSFPAIKKQINILEEAWIISIDKQDSRWSVSLEPVMEHYIKSLFIWSLKHDLHTYFLEQEFLLKQYFYGKLFGNQLEMDLVVIYQPEAFDFLNKIKEDINMLCRNYLIEMVWIVLMSSSDFERRYRLADKFVLTLMRSVKK
jgi:hypothetical protein